LAYTATALTVMVASPGDVAVQRRLAESVIHEWNAVHSRDRSTVLLPVLWETHASPAMGDRGQAIINKQLLESADLLVATFWTRIGSPTGKAISGTVEEIQEHVAAGKPAMIYFSEAPIRPDSVDEEQYREVKAFREWCKANGLYEIYESPEEFREKFRRQLAQRIIEKFPPRSTDSQGGGAASPTVDASPAVRLRADDRDTVAHMSPEARQLLGAALQDGNATVLMLETMGGLSITTGGHDFVSRGDLRSESRWRSAVVDLVDLRLLEQRDQKGQVFTVTDEGFRIGDLLNLTP
jgi:hypothetical protein